MRQFIGEGWSVGKPTAESIKKNRSRLSNVTIAIQYPAAAAAPKKKAKKAGVPHDEADLDTGVPQSPAAEDLFKYLKDQAARSQGKGLVEFYGCSRCRWILTGCISATCNPKKFLANYKAFPEKYSKKPGAKFAELKLEAERALTKAELMQ